MSDIDAAGMSHIGPKKDIARERVARAWHAGSEHAAETPFGGPLCNCWQVAERMLPMLRDAFDDGWYARAFPASRETLNPYEEGRHVDQ